MLSALSRTAARVMGVRAEAGHRTAPRTQEDDYLYVDVDVDIHELLNPLPEFAWARVTDLYANTVAPMYRVVRDTLQDDMEQLAFILDEPPPSRRICGSSLVADLEASCPRQDSDAIGCCTPSGLLSACGKPSTLDTNANEVWLLRSASCSLPSIVVTLCPSRPRDFACLVPFQDAHFGNRLAVPTHPALNAVYPPLFAQGLPIVHRWRYERGHWYALLPDLEEQKARGLFSRPSSATRRRRVRSAMR